MSMFWLEVAKASKSSSCGVKPRGSRKLQIRKVAPFHAESGLAAVRSAREASSRGGEGRQSSSMKLSSCGQMLLDRQPQSFGDVLNPGRDLAAARR